MTSTAREHNKVIRYPGFATLLVVWTLLAIFAYIRHLLLAEGTQIHLFRDLAGWVTCYYPWVLFTPVVFRLERRFPIDRIHWRIHLIWLALAGIPLCYATAQLTAILGLLELLAFREPLVFPSPWWAPAWDEYLLHFALYAFVVAGAVIIRNLIETQESERKAAQLALEKSEIEASLRRSELETLRMRLNPHFLFNCLQNISTLARQDPDAASQMLARLGDVLRAALRKGAQAQTTLSAEIELTNAYVGVEQIRFAGRLSVLFEIEPGIERALVPSFLLQPLVENAITHGLRGVQLAGAIWIRGVRQLDQLVMTVRDNGSGPPAERLNELEMGIGLGSTSERLERMYPGRHTFSMQKLPEGGTEIRIALPLEWAEPTRENQPHELTSPAHRR
jgi:two-component system, LytTR family, sensor kinase